MLIGDNGQVGGWVRIRARWWCRHSMCPRLLVFMEAGEANSTGIASPELQHRLNCSDGMHVADCQPPLRSSACPHPVASHLAFP